MNTTDPTRKLQLMLEDIALAKTKAWWEKYLRGVIPFRGVGIPGIRKTLAVWRNETGIASMPDAEQLQFALALFEESIAEDKLAGILFLQDYLQDRLPWNLLFESYELLYKRDLICDWNTCDWFCVRVLGPTLVREGKPCAKVLRIWSAASHLWQARSGVVPFIKVAGDASYHLDIDEVCSSVIRREERFAKTSVGWLLRDVSQHDQGFVKSFVGKHYAHFSVESVRNATKYFGESEKKQYVDMVKNAEQGPAADADKPRR